MALETTTYGLLNGTNATANENFTNGVGTAGKALDASNFGANAALQAEAQKFGIPASQYATLLGCYRAGRGAVRHAIPGTRKANSK